MLSETLATGLTLHYDPGEAEAAELIREAIQKTVTLNGDLWGLDTPADCRVYIMTSLSSFVFQSAPWPARIALGLTFPLWYFRQKRMWPYVGGWEKRYGDRVVVGVKPPRLIETGASEIGDQIFIRQEDVRDKVQSVTCHELTHAFSSHLRLPSWLKEGLAMVTVDRYFGEATVRPDTLEALDRASQNAGSDAIDVRDPAAVVQQYARAYWLTRYIEETRPGLLKELLAEAHATDAWERHIMRGVGLSHEAFPEALAQAALAHYAGEAS